MSWAKLDDNFHMHPKTLAVGNAGAGLFARMLSWSCNHLTDGVVTGYAAVTLAGTDGTKLVDELVRVGWLEPQGDGSYKIHDFGKYNPPADIERRKREKNAEKQAKHRAKSTRSKTGTFESNQGSNRVTNQVTESVTNQGSNQGSTAVSNSVPVPVPVPPEEHTQNAGARGDGAARQISGPTKAILDALRSHDVFEVIASDDMAMQIAGDMGAGGKKLEWVIKAIDDAASKAKTARTLGKPFNADTLADKVVTFVRNARAPRDASAGATSGQGSTISTPTKPPYHAAFPFAPNVRSAPPQSMIDKFGKKPTPTPPQPAPVEGDS